MVKYEETLTGVFQALADPTRRAILDKLRAGEKTVGELSEPFNLSPPAISKHLRRLEQAGLLRQVKRGRQRWCYLNVQPMRKATTWLTRYRVFWERSLDSFVDYLGGLETGQNKRDEK